MITRFFPISCISPFTVPITSFPKRGAPVSAKRGLRIDFFLTSLDLSSKYVNSEIDHEIRAMEKPSDHCPVTLKLDI